MTEKDKNELIARLQGAAGLSADDKAALTKLLRTRQYGLVWEDKPEEVEELLRSQLPVLTEVKDKAIISEAADAPNHILIEGDNLEALNALAYSHEGKVDVIYIDPPYNTGNKDFVYNDSFVDTEDGYRHSKWLSFMDKRLRLAKRLLSEKGVIFISIDDNEQANLKLLCDTVFGSSNFIGLMTLASNPRGSQNSKFLSYIHEYIILYSKDSTHLQLKGVEKSDESLSEFSETDEDGRKYRLLGLRKRGGAWRKEERPNMFYPIYVDPITRRCSLTKSENFSIEVIPKRPTGELSRWTWGTDKFKNESHLLVGKPINRSNEPDAWDIFRKDYIDKEDGLIKETKLKTIWIEKETNYQNARNELNEIFGDSSVFDYPKPIYLITRCLTVFPSKSATVLDFFAGSGTTLHATMQLNAEDGGHRQCILVTNNENNICEEVTYERNRRVIQGYTNAKGQWVDGLTANNLRYYRVEHVARQTDNYTLHQLMSASTDLLCIKEGIYREEREFAGLKFKPSVARYFHEGEARMLIIYNELAVAPIAAHVAECGATSEHPLKIYVFSNGRYAYEDEFHSVASLVEVCAMPEALLQSMQSTLPPIHYGEEDYTPDAEAEAEALADDFNYQEGGEA